MIHRMLENKIAFVASPKISARWKNSSFVMLRNDKNTSTSVARNVKWARGTEVHTRQPDNKVENSAMRQGENSATQRSS